MRLREVGYPPHLAGLASWEDWRGFCLYSEFILSVTKISALFVKELSFPQTAPTDDAFSIGTWLERAGIAGPVLEPSLGRSASFGCCAPLQEQERKRIGGGLPIAAPMPKLVLSCGGKR